MPKMTKREMEKAFKLFMETCKEHIEMQKLIKGTMNHWVSRATTEEELGIAAEFLAALNDMREADKKIVDILDQLASIWEEKRYTPEFAEIMFSFLQSANLLKDDQNK